VVMIFVIGLVTGLIYSPSILYGNMFTDTEFFIAYFLEIFFFLSFALMISVLIQRSGLSIIFLLLSQMIEWIITANIDDQLPWIEHFFPMKSIWYLIEFPYQRYAFQEIKDYIDIKLFLIAAAWTVIFNYISYLKLKKSDI
jgi:ABC-type transport system involved in multi-copper enzyme maturation permease subunit